ncbi:MAG TPA: CoA transferase [Candidatus Binataceae bacterium]|nr:CoA transferase [Candidatus Binataceae bacterium]
MARLPLEGIRVLDFTWVVAGPVATRILADHGAQVIKIERKSPPPLGNRKLGLQCDLHRGKLSAAINMGSPRGVDLARKLAAKSDLVIDNFSARVMRGWGMDYASLEKIKPDIICISMSGLGHTGPRSSYVSYGPTLQALSGYTLMMAEPGGTPAGYGYSYADMCGGYTGALAALAALWNRKRTGRGQFVDLSQFEAVTAVIGPALLDISVNGREQKPFGYDSQEAPAAPHGVYRCRPRGGADSDPGENADDRWVAISVHTQAEWERFSAALGSPQWTTDAKFRTLYLRIRNRAELDARISRWTAERSPEDVMTTLQDARVAAGVVENGIDLCTRDPQLRERGFWPTVATAAGVATQVTGIPFRISNGSGVVRSVGPDVGENGDYVLGEILGLGRAERDELIEAGAVWA